MDPDLDLHTIRHSFSQSGGDGKVGLEEFCEWITVYKAQLSGKLRQTLLNVSMDDE